MAEIDMEQLGELLGNLNDRLGAIEGEKEKSRSDGDIKKRLSDSYEAYEDKDGLEKAASYLAERMPKNQANYGRSAEWTREDSEKTISDMARWALENGYDPMKFIYQTAIDAGYAPEQAKEMAENAAEETAAEAGNMAENAANEEKNMETKEFEAAQRSRRPDSAGADVGKGKGLMDMTPEERSRLEQENPDAYQVLLAKM